VVNLSLDSGIRFVHTLLTIRAYMKFSFTFSYHRDRIRVWPWLWFLHLFGKIGDSHCFLSESYGDYFNHFSDYWQKVGKKSALLEVIQRQKGLSVEGRGLREIIVRYCAMKFPYQTSVVIFDVSMDSALRTLGNLPGFDKKVLLEDVLIFPFPHREDAMKLARAIPSSLGEMIVVHEGTEVSVETGFNGWENF